VVGTGTGTGTLVTQHLSTIHASKYINDNGNSNGNGNGDDCYPTCIEYYYNDNITIVGFLSGHIRFYKLDINDGELIIEISGHSRSITSLALHPTLPLFVSCSDDQNINLWNIPNTSISRAGASAIASASAGSSICDIECNIKWDNNICTGVAWFENDIDIATFSSSSSSSSSSDTASSSVSNYTLGCVSFDNNEMKLYDLILRSQVGLVKFNEMKLSIDTLNTARNCVSLNGNGNGNESNGADYK